VDANLVTTTDTLTSTDWAQLQVESTRHRDLFDRRTSLPKAVLLLDRTEVALARSGRSNTLVAVFVLDEPKLFAQGVVDMGAIAAALKAAVRPGDTLARIGDRQFAIVCGDIPADENAALIARRLMQAAGVMCNLGIALGDATATPVRLIGDAIVAARQPAVA
jgi:GGDEF domain-containing protein